MVHINKDLPSATFHIWSILGGFTERIYFVVYNSNANGCFLRIRVALRIIILVNIDLGPLLVMNSHSRYNLLITKNTNAQYFFL